MTLGRDRHMEQGKVAQEWSHPIDKIKIIRMWAI